MLCSECCVCRDLEYMTAPSSRMAMPSDDIIYMYVKISIFVSSYYDNLWRCCSKCSIVLSFRRVMHIGNVMYWSAPPSKRLRTTFSDCCHEITYIDMRCRDVARMLDIISEPSRNGAMARNIISDGGPVLQRDRSCSKDVQWMICRPSSSIIEVTKVARCCEGEYMMILLFIIWRLVAVKCRRKMCQIWKCEKNIRQMVVTRKFFVYLQAKLWQNL